MAISARRALLAGITGLGLILVPACTTVEDSDPAESAAQTGAATTDATGEEAAPESVTVDHAWGTDEYPYQPEKIVAIGTGVDNLLALGITPDAIIARPDDAAAVWKKDEVADVPRIKSEDITAMPVEEIAALEPDIIVGDSYRVPEKTYQELKPVAPVLGGIGREGEGLGWKPQLEQLGRIFGKEDEAARIISEDGERFAEVREELPALAGATALISQHRSGQFFVIADPENPSNDFFEDLGMGLPEKFTDGQVEAKLGRAAVSPENVQDLAADLLVLYAADGMDAVRAVPGYEELPEVEAGTVVEHDQPVSAALNVPSSLAREWVLEKLRPVLEKIAEARQD